MPFLNNDLHVYIVYLYTCIYISADVIKISSSLHCFKQRKMDDITLFLFMSLSRVTRFLFDQKLDKHLQNRRHLFILSTLFIERKNDSSEYTGNSRRSGQVCRHVGLFNNITSNYSLKI